MAESPAGLLALGFLVGTFGTLIGAGGGVILVPALLFLYPHLSPAQVTAISLVVVAFNALSGSTAYALKRRIHYPSGLFFALASAPGTAVGASWVRKLPKETFEPLFGALILAVSVFLLIKEGKKTETKENETLKLGPKGLAVGFILSFFVGVLAGLLGIGGGIIHVPALVYWVGFPVHIATATSHLILAIMATVGSLENWRQGLLVHTSGLLLWLVPGVIVGAQAGAHWSHYVRGAWIVRGLAVALLLLALRLLL